MRQQSSRASRALDRRTHFARAPAAPSDSCPWPERLLKLYHHALAPGRRARSREGHAEERTEAHDTGEIDWKKEELEVPKGTSRLVPSRGTCRAPIWTRAPAPSCDFRSSKVATPSPIMRTEGRAPIVTCFLALPACHPPRRRRYLGTEGHESSDSYTPVFPSESLNQCETELRSRNQNQRAVRFPNHSLIHGEIRQNMKRPIRHSDSARMF